MVAGSIHRRLPISGRMRGVGRDRDAPMLLRSDVGTSRSADQQTVFALNVPLPTLPRCHHDVDAVQVGAAAQEDVGLRLLRGYIAVIERELGTTADEQLRRLTAAHVRDLVA